MAGDPKPLPPAQSVPQRRPAWPSRDVLRVALLIAGVWLALRLLWVARSVFVLAFLGVLFGITLSAGVTWLKRYRIPRTLGTLLLVLIFFGGFIGLGVILAPHVADQVQQLQQQLPDALAQAEAWLRERQGWISQMLQPGAGGQQPQAGEPANLRATLAQQIAGASRHFFTIFSSTLAVLGSILVITFIAVFIAVEPRTYRRGIMHLMPHEARPKAAEIMDAMATTLRRWLVAQVIGMLLIGIVTTVVLLLLGVPAPFALGIIAGILEFIPYFGPILSAVPAVAMGFLEGPEMALWVAVAYLAIQQIEGNLLMPLLMKEGLDLPPALTIVVQAAFALVFGFVGLLIAVPLLGTVMVPIKLLYVQDVVGDQVTVPGMD